MPLAHDLAIRQGMQHSKYRCYKPKVYSTQRRGKTLCAVVAALGNAHKTHQYYLRAASSYHRAFFLRLAHQGLNQSFPIKKDVRYQATRWLGSLQGVIAHLMPADILNLTVEHHPANTGEKQA